MKHKLKASTPWPAEKKANDGTSAMPQNAEKRLTSLISSLKPIPHISTWARYAATNQKKRRSHIILNAKPGGVLPELPE